MPCWHRSGSLRLYTANPAVDRGTLVRAFRRSLSRRGKSRWLFGRCPAGEAIGRAAARDNAAARGDGLRDSRFLRLRVAAVARLVFLLAIGRGIDWRRDHGSG